MSLDDPRHVRPELQLVPVEIDDDDGMDAADEDVYEEDPGHTPEERAELHRTLMAELEQSWQDIQAGRATLIPWDDAANRWMFGEDD